MKTTRRFLAVTELLLISPAALFMAALFVRNLQPEQYEPARTAVRIVDLYSHSTRIGLWLFMMAFPLAVLVIGCMTLARSWRADPTLRQAAQNAFAALRAHLASFMIAAATVTAAGILAVVALHLIAD